MTADSQRPTVSDDRPTLTLIRSAASRPRRSRCRLASLVGGFRPGFARPWMRSPLRCAQLLAFGSRWPGRSTAPAIGTAGSAVSKGVGGFSRANVTGPNTALASGVPLSCHLLAKNRQRLAAAIGASLPLGLRPPRRPPSPRTARGPPAAAGSARASLPAAGVPAGAPLRCVRLLALSAPLRVRCAHHPCPLPGHVASAGAHCGGICVVAAFKSTGPPIRPAAVRPSAAGGLRPRTDDNGRLKGLLAIRSTELAAVPPLDPPAVACSMSDIDTAGRSADASARVDSGKMNGRSALSLSPAPFRYAPLLCRFGQESADAATDPAETGKRLRPCSIDLLPRGWSHLHAGKAAL